VDESPLNHGHVRDDVGVLPGQNVESTKRVVPVFVAELLPKGVIEQLAEGREVIWGQVCGVYPFDMRHSSSLPHVDASSGDRIHEEPVAVRDMKPEGSPARSPEVVGAS
jgi:hypothetical protein